jgi:carboxypeptidase D
VASNRAPNIQSDGTPQPSCNLWEATSHAAQDLNPCFNVYELAVNCPFPYDPIGFNTAGFIPPGSPPVYFNRSEVKEAINAPVNQDWAFCTDPVFINGTDTSVTDGPGSEPVLPGVIDRTGNVIIGHGHRDFVLISDGILLAIQNITWGGKRGFQQRPIAPLYIPYFEGNGDDTRTLGFAAGAGVLGTAHSERGLTYLIVGHSGHFIFTDTPGVPFRALEVLLGRVPYLQSTLPFTIDVDGTEQPADFDMGNGTVIIGE